MLTQPTTLGLFRTHPWLQYFPFLKSGLSNNGVQAGWWLGHCRNASWLHWHAYHRIVKRGNNVVFFSTHYKPQCQVSAAQKQTCSPSHHFTIMFKTLVCSQYVIYCISPLKAAWNVEPQRQSMLIQNLFQLRSQQVCCNLKPTEISSTHLSGSGSGSESAINYQ